MSEMIKVEKLKEGDNLEVGNYIIWVDEAFYGKKPRKLLITRATNKYAFARLNEHAEMKVIRTIKKNGRIKTTGQDIWHTLNYYGYRKVDETEQANPLPDVSR